TVMHDRGGEPERLIAATLLADGRRAWVNVADATVARDFVTDEQVGRRVMLRRSGELESA
ncbi:MAG: Thiolase-like protein type 1 additional C-terminal domain, partial [Actinomycetota bacterium]